MRKDRIVEITGLAILLIQRLYGKDYKNAVVTFYLLFVIAILDREITEENILELYGQWQNWQLELDLP